MTPPPAPAPRRFSNANVIFRTKFVEGTSTVLRTVPATSALLGGKPRAPAAALTDRAAAAEADGDDDAARPAAGKKAKAPRAAAGGAGGAGGGGL